MTENGKIMGDSQIKIILIIALVTAIAITFHFMNPATLRIFPKCMFHSLTGLHCPGCGTTRAAHAFFNGHIRAAFGHNALVMTSAHLAAALYLASIVSSNARNAITAFFSDRRTLVAIGLLILAFTVLRNLPQYPFNLLSP